MTTIFEDGNLVALKNPSNNDLLAYCFGCYRGGPSHSVFVHSQLPNITTSPWAIWEVKKLSNDNIAFRNLHYKFFLHPQSSVVSQRNPIAIVGGNISMESLIGHQPELISGHQYKFKSMAAGGNYLSRCLGCSVGGAQPISATYHIADSNSDHIKWEIILIDKNACCEKRNSALSSSAICGSFWGTCAPVIEPIPVTPTLSTPLATTPLATTPLTQPITADTSINMSNQSPDAPVITFNGEPIVMTDTGTPLLVNGTPVTLDRIQPTTEDNVGENNITTGNYITKSGESIMLSPNGQPYIVSEQSPIANTESSVWYWIILFIIVVFLALIASVIYLNRNTYYVPIEKEL